MSPAAPVPIHSFRSPLRYPGGKGPLAEFMKLVVRENKLYGGDYVEVYAGGAAIAWSLLFGEYVQDVHINDLNASVYAFWRSVLEHTDELCALIETVEVTMDEWYRQREVQSSSSTHNVLELGFSTFFLNRTNRSGILRGGVIGGKEQEGKWKLDARFNKADLIARIRRIAWYRDRIHLYKMDAADLIREQLPLLPQKTLVYLDPPYYRKGKELYEDHYGADDHAIIAGLVTGIGQPWIVSYDAVPEVSRLYGCFQSLEYRVSYSAQNQYAGSEVMFFGPRVKVPKIEDPTKCKSGRSGQLGLVQQSS